MNGKGKGREEENGNEVKKKNEKKKRVSDKNGDFRQKEKTSKCWPHFWPKNRKKQEKPANITTYALEKNCNIHFEEFLKFVEHCAFQFPRTPSLFEIPKKKKTHSLSIAHRAIFSSMVFRL